MRHGTIAAIALLTGLLLDSYACADESVKKGEIIVTQPYGSFASRSRHPERRFGPGVNSVRLLTNDGLTRVVRLDAISSQVSSDFDPLELASGCAELKRFAPDIRLCEANFQIRKQNTPNDPNYSVLHGLSKISAPAAWDITTGSRNVTVAVVDTGMDYTHPDLVSNLWTNNSEIPENGIDDDRNGYVDDYYGANAVSDNGDPFDDNGHGTHVAGTIGASGNDGQGVVGVNWNVRLMAGKFLDQDGSGYTSDAISMITYAINNGAKIINASWGGGGASSALKKAIQNAADHSVLFMAAAGNDGTDNDESPSYPANYAVDNLISVASTDRSDEIAYFSNYGAQSVHIAAPGVAIYSTYPGGDYRSLSGTSMATPHVSGVAALALAAFPDENYHQIRSRVLDGDPISGLSAILKTGTRLNAERALSSTSPPTDDTGTVNKISAFQGYSNSGYKDYLLKGRNFKITLKGASASSAEVALRFKGKRLGSLDDCTLGTVTFSSDTVKSLIGRLKLTGTMNYASSVTAVMHNDTTYDTIKRSIREDTTRSKSARSAKINVRADFLATCKRIVESLSTN